MLASLGDGRKVSMSEAGGDSQTREHKTGHSSLHTDPWGLAASGLGIQPQVKHRDILVAHWQPLNQSHLW